jgi:hypothetical protein
MASDVAHAQEDVGRQLVLDHEVPLGRPRITQVGIDAEGSERSGAGGK